jgi:tryptophanyl-tRNA synthetase
MRVLSGITPSGECHIGNYFGAMRQHVALQHDNEAIYFMADYHSMNSVRDAAERRQMVLDVALDYLAIGLDPEQAVIYRQSDLPELCELTWVLTTLTPMGLLERGHAFKDKTARGQSADHGLFAYPVLMAADILIYNPDIVPVGQDQKQHIEMCRDIAQRFNSTYGVEVFKLPEPEILESVAVVPGTDGAKMSKSYGNTLRMFWPEKKLKKAIMSIETDSTPVEGAKDTDQTVFQLWSLFADAEAKAEMWQRAAAGGLGYGDVKKDLLARMLEHFGEMRARREELAASSDDVEDILRAGAAKARALAAPVVAAVHEATGIGPRA